MNDAIIKHNKYQCVYYKKGKCAYYCPATMPNEVRDITKGYDCGEEEPVITGCFMWNEGVKE
jgi:hypothetical protein